MIKKTLVFFLVSVVLVVSIAACGSQPSANQSSTISSDSAVATTTAQSQATVQETKKISGEIHFLTYRDDLLNSWYPDALKDFNAKYPDIKITTETSKNYDDDLKVKMAAGDIPDVLAVDGSFSDSLFESNLLPLDDVFPDLVQSWQGNDGYVSQNTKKTYALTLGLNTEGLAYNKKIFAKLGLTPPKTLDELIATGKTLKENGYIGLAGCLKPIWTTDPYMYLVRATMDNIGEQYQKMAETDTPFTTDSTFAQMYTMFTKIWGANIMEDDPLSYDWEPYLKDMGSGKIGMSMTWSTTLVQYPDRGDGSLTVDDFGLVPFPYDNSGGPYKVLNMSDYALAIAKNSKNLDAAEAFFKWHMDDKYADYAKLNANLSANKNISTDISYLKEFYASNPQQVIDVKMPTAFKSIVDKAQIDFDQPFVDLATGISVQQELDKLNAAWKKARASK